MNLSKWFRDQLTASAEGFLWSAQQVPAARRLVTPPEGLGEWSVARHVFHLIFYERHYALPWMRVGLGEAKPSLAGLDEAGAWDGCKDAFDRLLTEFRQVRDEQIALLDRFDQAAWETTIRMDWGTFPISWYVTKTYQHTAEHTSDVLKMALFWDAVRRRG